MTTINTLDRAPSLLAAILAEPDADDLRLIYADWLEDHGEEERADLIRWMLKNVKVEAKFKHDSEGGNYFTCWSDHSLEGNPWRPRWQGEQTGSWACSMRVAMVGTDDVPDEPPFGITDDFTVIFRRGFIAEIHAPLAVLQQHLPALVRQHPIERVRVTNKEPAHYNGLTESYIWWRHVVPRVPQAVLPQAVWDAVREVDNPPGPYLENGKRFPTAEAAHAALSEVLLKVAKTQRIKQWPSF